MQIQLVDAIENADTVGDMHHRIARCKIGEGTDLLTLALFGPLFGNRTRFHAGDDRKLDFRVLKAGRELVFHHKDLAIDHVFDILAVIGREPVFPQVGHKGRGGLCRTCQYNTAIVLLHERGEIIRQQLQFPAPGGSLNRRCGDQILQAQIVRLGKGVQIHRTPLLNGIVQQGKIHTKVVKALAQFPFFQKEFDVFPVGRQKAARALLDSGIFADKNHRIFQVVQQRRRFFINHPNVFIVRGQLQPRSNPLHILLKTQPG